MPNIEASTSKLDEALTLIDEARDEVADLPSFVGRSAEPGSEGFFGPVIHDVRVLRGRVADAATYSD